MFQSRIDLVLELFTVYGSTAATGAGGVAGLEHEVWDYAVEDDVVVVAALSEGGEVGAGLGSRLSVRRDGKGRDETRDFETGDWSLHTLGAWVL